MKLAVSARWRVVFLAGHFVFPALGVARADGVPPDLLAALESEDFKEREKAEKELLEWAVDRDPEVRADFLRLHRAAVDPEVRHRSLRILKELVTRDYLKEGTGFIGIEMQAEEVQLPGEPQPPVGAIRITSVMGGTPAERAGLKVDDLIVGLNGESFEADAMPAAFSGKVGEFKPDTEIVLQILRDGDLMDLKVRLMRRPGDLNNNRFMDNRFFPNRERIDIEASDRAAKEAYFRAWLGRQ